MKLNFLKLCFGYFSGVVSGFNIFHIYIWLILILIIIKTIRVSISSQIFPISQMYLRNELDPEWIGLSFSFFTFFGGMLSAGISDYLYLYRKITIQVVCLFFLSFQFILYFLLF